MKQADKKQKRGRIIKIRLTEEEYEMLKSKSRFSSSKSSFIRKLINNADEENIRNKVISMIEIKSLFKNISLNFSEIGNNINQVARVVNLQASQNIQAEETIRNEFLPLIKSLQDDIKKFRLSNSRLYDQIKKK